MNRKKSVIFHIDNKQQFYAEFHENSKLSLLKSYFKDVSHVNNFSFLCNDRVCTNDDIKIKSLIKGESHTLFLKIIFNTNELNNSISYIGESILKDNQDLKTENTELLDSINRLREDNLNSSNLVLELQNKIAILTKSNQSLSNNDHSQKKQLDQLRNEKNEIEFLFRELKEKYDKIMTQRTSMMKRTSINHNSSNDSTLNRSPINNSKESKFMNSRLRASLIESNTKLNAKEDSIEIESFVIVKKETSIKPTVWHIILSYLDKTTHKTISMLSREYFTKVTSYLREVTSLNIDKLDLQLKTNSQQYVKALQEEKFKVSNTTNSSLKVLNQKNYLSIFKNDTEYFEDPKISLIYRLFFQITKIYTEEDYNKAAEFANFIKYYFTEIVKSNLGDYIKSLVTQCDFTEKNVAKLASILDYYYSAIDSVALAKVCKTTSFISFFVKDALCYCGLDTNKQGKIHSASEKLYSVIKINKDLRSSKNDSEKIVKKLDHSLLKYKK